MPKSEELLKSLREQRLLSDEQLAQVTASLLPGELNSETLSEALRSHGGLTEYQLEQALSGQTDALVLNGTYALLERIGEGGMGQVFRAKHLVLKSIRAVKLIRPECTASRMAVDRFTREMEAVARLNHPNIVQAYDAGETDGTHFLVMEYIEGEDLSKMIRREGAFSIADAANYVRQAASGLQHAFEQGLIHRDIKPSNLLLSNSGTIKILDLGLARLRDEEPADQLTPTGMVMGTPDYVAPEQTIDSKHVDIRADIYALGCTLYHLLAGKVPFPGGDTINKLIRHRQKKAKPITGLRNDVPQEMVEILNRMLAKHPKNRPATPQEVVDALEPFCREPSSNAPRAPKPVVVGSSPSRAETAPEPDRKARPPKAEAVTEAIEPIPDEEDTSSFSPESRLPKVLMVALITLVLLGGAGLGVFLLTREKHEPRGNPGQVARERLAFQQSQTEKNLKQIGIALHEFAFENRQSLPPPFLRPRAFPRRPGDVGQGRPGLLLKRGLSWRVSMLPYLGHRELYAKFRLEEPWDSEHNKKLIREMPDVYRHPAMSETGEGMTHFQFVTGPKTLHGAPRPLRLEIISDGTTNTIFVMDAKTPVIWTAPEDVEYSEASDPRLLLNDVFLPKGYLVLMVDGSIHRVPKDISEKTLRNAIMHNDGNVLGPDWE